MSIESVTFPQQASACRKGSFIMIRSHACKITEMSQSKTGKHGHAKCKFTGVDIFDKKFVCEMQETSTHNVQVPNVKRTEYQLIGISDDNYMSLMHDTGETRQDVRLPDGELRNKILEAFDDEHGDVMITILNAIGRERVLEVKKIQYN